MTPLSVLEHNFGYSTFRGEQEQVVSAVCRGEHVMVIMPTGAGKSLCYQIPSIVRAGVGVVISPLIALMQDQVTALENLGVKAGFLNSSLSFYEADAIESSLLHGDLDLLYVAPERLLQSRTLEMLSRCQIALFAIDEAHCVSQWGHDFRKDYLGLSVLAEAFPSVPRIALTATADERTRQEICDRLSLADGKHFVCGFDRPNIQYRIRQKDKPRNQLLSFLQKEHPSDAGVVYCLSRKKVEETARWLSEKGFKALPFHAGLAAQIKRENQERFLREENIIIVATIAFGMGIDKPDVRFVVHMDMPKSVEAYYQETGRAGRDGEDATALLLYGIEDVVKLKQMVENSEASEQFKRLEQQRLTTLLGLCEITSCRRQVLLRYFGETDTLPCGNCDNCLTPPQTWDATRAAQMALSCVYRTGQRFGTNYIIDVLRGAQTERIRQFGHNTVSTYGIGHEFAPNQWRAIMRQLIVGGFLHVDADGYGVLSLTELARPVLKGEQVLEFREVEKEAASGFGKQTKKRRVVDEIEPGDMDLWHALRACRKRLSDERSVPPYVIFSDATLKEMIVHRPQTHKALLAVSGVGDQKLQSFGDAFLEVLNESEYLLS